MSPYEPFELASLVYAKPIGANLVSNSQETAKKINSFFMNSHKIYNFNNATKDDFVEKKILPTQSFKPIESVLIVSNHIPDELGKAAENLTKLSVKVEAFGLGQQNYKRLSKPDIQKFDVVVTIGKTVQSAILARRPVYCYDRFGGPGYIRIDNFKTSLDFNYSGRCCRRKLEPKQLCDEIISGYNGARKDVNDLFDMGSELFNLKIFLNNLSKKKSALTNQTVDTQPIIEYAKLVRSLYFNSLQIQNGYKLSLEKPASLAPNFLFDGNVNLDLNQDLKLLYWGPDSYSEGALPNIQPNGEVGIWIKIQNLDKLNNPSLIINDNLMLVDLVVEGDLITATLPKELFDDSSVRLQLVSQYDRLAIPIGVIKKSLEL
ncbi:MAG: hypothetical protein VX941_05440 [Pseudomonadota bacterium]|nr:hypothetical protein [Pseudomonadota bacterium]